MTSLDRRQISRILADLAVRRPVFHSEADFQHALAWAIHDAQPSASVRLEVPRQIGERRAHVDLWIADGGRRIGIELKYLTRRIDAIVGDEHYALRDQAAQDLGRYDILKDLVRIESLIASGDADAGFLVALTNDSSYWKASDALVPRNYEAFRLMEGRMLEGVLAWGPATGPGTMKGRETAIALCSRYVCAWTPYSDLGTPRYGRFRYLMLEAGQNNEPQV